MLEYCFTPIIAYKVQVLRFVVGGQILSKEFPDAAEIPCHIQVVYLS